MGVVGVCSFFVFACLPRSFCTVLICLRFHTNRVFLCIAPFLETPSKPVEACLRMGEGGGRNGEGGVGWGRGEGVRGMFRGCLMVDCNRNRHAYRRVHEKEFERRREGKGVRDSCTARLLSPGRN